MTSPFRPSLTGGILGALRTPVIPPAPPAATAPAPPPPAAAVPPPPPPPPFFGGGGFGLQPNNPLGTLGGVVPPKTAPPPPPAAAPPPPPPSPAGPPPGQPFTLATTAISPALLSTVLQPMFTLPPPQRTVTQVAQDAVAQLRGAATPALSEAVRTLQAKNVQGKDIMSLLERRTRIGEVLSGSASRWSADTVGDFAAAFQMDATRIGAMDLIVALAVVNDAGVEAELRSENLPPATPQDFLQNRKVVFQYPPPGTELTPPYVILVAVESQDFARADEAVNAIYGQLVDFQGYRMPRDAAARLG